MCQTLPSIDFTCMASGTACACLRHLHACGTCILAALALLQHVHDGGIGMCLVAAYALALVLQMHMCGKCMCAALCAFCKTCMAMASCSMCTNLPPGRGSFASLAASPCASCKTSMANCSMFTDLPPGRGSFASLAASPCAPRSCSHGKHGLKPMPAPADVGCQGSQHRFKVVFFFPFSKHLLVPYSTEGDYSIR